MSADCPAVKGLGSRFIRNESLYGGTGLGEERTPQAIEEEERGG